MHKSIESIVGSWQNSILFVTAFTFIGTALVVVFNVFLFSSLPSFSATLLQVTLWAAMSLMMVAIIQGDAVKKERLLRRSTEKALRKTDKRLRRLYDHAADAFFVHDVSGKVIDANARASESLGYSRKELLKLTVTDVEVGITQEKLTHFWKRIKPGVTHNLDGIHRRKDGTTFPVEIRLRLVHTDGQRLMLAVARDMTERKKAQEILRRTEARYRRNFELGSIGMAITTGDMDWSEVNDSLCNMLGYTKEHLLKYTWSELTHPEDLTADAELYARVIASDVDEYTQEKRFIRQDGQVIHTVVSTNCERREDGSIDYFVLLVRDITKQKRAEQALARQATVIDQIRDSVIAMDLAGVTMSWNKGAERLFGYTLDEAVGRHIDFLYPESDRSSILRQIIEPAINNGAYDAVVLMQKKSGDYFYAHLSLSLVRDPNGAITGLIAYALDVTKRKQAQDSLRASLNLLETLLDTIPSPVFYKDAAGVYRRCNAAFAEQIIGLPRDQIIGKTIFELTDAVPHDVAKVYHDADMKLMGQPGTQFYEAQVQTTDGGHRDYFFYKATFNNAAGSVAGMVGVMLDLTDLKHTERQLITRLHYEEGVASCSEELLSDADEKQVLIHATRHLLEASGVSRVYVFENFNDPQAGLCARQISEVCADNIDSAMEDPALQHLPYTLFPKAFKQHLSEGNRFETTVPDLPEETRALLEPFNIKSFLVLPTNVAGSWHGFIGFDDCLQERQWTNQDVRLLETAARMIGAYLGRKQSDRNLRQAKDAAEAATHAKSQFLANMSHEIRTPMTAILGYTDLLFDQQLQLSEQLQCFDTIRRNGQHLLALIDDILDLSRIEAGKLQVRTDQCALDDIITNTFQLMAPRAEAKQLALNINTARNTPARMVTDPIRLQQILLNLIGNAIKFTDRGKVELSITHDRSNELTPDIATIQFRVTDTGIGITPEQKSKLFKPFTQADPSMSRKYGGTGLGLAISRRLAELLGGTITCGSQPQGGTWFAFTFTTKVSDENLVLPEEKAFIRSSHDQTPAPAKRPANQYTPKLQCRILLAEDGIDNQRLISRLLTSAGAQVDVADNGKIAADKALHSLAENKPYDLILMDMQMPELDGYKATQLLRNNKFPGPIVALTAHAMTRDRQKCLDAGCSDYATKPIKKHELIELVQRNTP